MSNQVTEEHDNKGAIDTVYIQLKLKDTEINLEKIQSFPLSLFDLKSLSLTRKVDVHILRTEMFINTASLGLLLDAIESSDTDTIVLNKKLAPYQCSICIYSKGMYNSSLLRY